MIRLALAILLVPFALFFVILQVVILLVELTAVGIVVVIYTFLPLRHNPERQDSLDLTKQGSDASTRSWGKLSSAQLEKRREF